MTPNQILAAKQLAELITALNPNCLSMGAGMMQTIQALAKEVLSISQNPK